MPISRTYLTLDTILMREVSKNQKDKNHVISLTAAIYMCTSTN